MDNYDKATAVSVVEMVFTFAGLMGILVADPETNWAGVAGVAATAYVIADVKVREHHHDAFGGHDYMGISEFLYHLPRDAYRRYKSWREIRAIDALSRKGEVFV